jgi:hypothetical protein
MKNANDTVLPYQLWNLVDMVEVIAPWQFRYICMDVTLQFPSCFSNSEDF